MSLDDTIEENDISERDLRVYGMWEYPVLEEDRIDNRKAGGVMAIAGGLAIAYFEPTFWDIWGSLFLMEGLGDALTGKHHYFSSRVGRLLTGNSDWPHKEGVGRLYNGYSQRREKNL